FQHAPARPVPGGGGRDGGRHRYHAERHVVHGDGGPLHLLGPVGARHHGGQPEQRRGGRRHGGDGDRERLHGGDGGLLRQRPGGTVRLRGPVRHVAGGPRPAPGRGDRRYHGHHRRG